MGHAILGYKRGIGLLPDVDGIIAAIRAALPHITRGVLRDAADSSRLCDDCRINIKARAARQVAR
jgi:hypothetical protein